MRFRTLLLRLVIATTVTSVLPEAGAARAATGSLTLRVTEDGETPLPCRVHLERNGEFVAPPGERLFFRDHFAIDGTAKLELEAGTYGYRVARGLEYVDATGEVEVTEGGAALDVRLERWIDLAAMGWWSGETHVHRPLEDVPLLLASEDLHVAPVLTQWNRQNRWENERPPTPLIRELPGSRFIHILGAEDERQGGALFFLGLRRPLDIAGAGREHPSPVRYLDAASRQGAWIEVEKPFWWDAPTWVATGEIDAIGIANNHMCRVSQLANEAWGRPRDAETFPGPRGNGFYTQDIWYRLLDCGFRLPPTAGSASGVLPNPVGYNRAYVKVDGALDYDAWFRGLAAGRSFVTNGPVLLVEANGRGHGEVFRSAGDPIDIELDVRIGSRDPIESVDIIKDGEIVERLEATGDVRSWVRPTRLRFTKSGWFVVRAVTIVPETFRFASTSAFWVEIGEDTSRIDAKDARWFVAWIDERMAALRNGTSEALDAEKLREVLEPHERARRAFLELVLLGE